MSAWPQEYDSPITTDTPLVTTTETVIATLSGVTSSGPGQRVKLHGWAQVTAGTSTTAVTLRVRQGAGITGTVVGEANPVQGGVVAATTASLDIDVTDALAGEIANQTYVLTAQQVAASANGSVLQASLRATL